MICYLREEVFALSDVQSRWEEKGAT